MSEKPASGWPLEARLNLINEVMMAVGHHDRVVSTSGARQDFFYLTRAIIEDTKYSCTARQNLIGVLKKSAAWPKVKLFLKNSDDTCKTKKCNHGEWEHRTGVCTGHHGKYVKKPNGGYDWVRTPCHCQKYTYRDF